MGASRLFPGLIVGLVALSACVPRAAVPPPRPAPTPHPAPAPPRPAPPPPAPAPPAGWEDATLATGDWSYSDAGGGPQASFGAAGGTLFALRCDAGGQIRIVRPGTVAIVTSFGERALSSAGTADQSLATLPASDPLFDQIAFSRGRFLVRIAGGGDLVLPAWPEPARLIEECRAQ